MFAMITIVEIDLQWESGNWHLLLSHSRNFDKKFYRNVP